MGYIKTPLKNLIKVYIVYIIVLSGGYQLENDKLLDFTWDKEKYDKNYQKHGIRFEEASTVFYDENMIYKMDVWHSVNEERYIVIGMSNNTRLLMVCHCIGYGTSVRIISARRANKSETQEYERR